MRINKKIKKETNYHEPEVVHGEHLREEEKKLREKVKKKVNPPNSDPAVPEE